MKPRPFAGSGCSAGSPRPRRIGWPQRSTGHFSSPTAARCACPRASRSPSKSSAKPSIWPKPPHTGANRCWYANDEADAALRRVSAARLTGGGGGGQGGRRVLEADPRVAQSKSISRRNPSKVHGKSQTSNTFHRFSAVVERALGARCQLLPQGWPATVDIRRKSRERLGARLSS